MHTHRYSPIHPLHIPTEYLFTEFGHSTRLQSAVKKKGRNFHNNWEEVKFDDIRSSASAKLYCRYI